MKLREAMIEVPDGQVWYRSIGEGGVPLLCLHGGPGMTHNYIDPLEDRADRRQVISYDQLGCGKSERLPYAPSGFWTPQLFKKELAELVVPLNQTTKYPCCMARI